MRVFRTIHAKTVVFVQQIL